MRRRFAVRKRRQPVTAALAFNKHGTAQTKPQRERHKCTANNSWANVLKNSGNPFANIVHNNNNVLQQSSALSLPNILR